MILTWQQIPSPIVSEILANLDCDGVVIDTEHGSFNNETLTSCIQVVTLSGKKCFVRLAEETVTMVRICLDSGADGLIFSTVETHAQAEKITSMCLYPSQKSTGRRGMGLVRQNKWGQEPLDTKKPLLIAQIESKKGVDNIGQIASRNFDYYLVGPYDLTSSLGIPGQFDHDLYHKYLDKVVSSVGKHKMGIHIPSDIAREIPKYDGYGVLALGMDTTLMIESHTEAIDNA
jgi:2-dehydro-3-deoxyglucarate aldolase